MHNTRPYTTQTQDESVIDLKAKLDVAKNNQNVLKNELSRICEEAANKALDELAKEKYNKLVRKLQNDIANCEAQINKLKDKIANHDYGKATVKYGYTCTKGLLYHLLIIIYCMVVSAGIVLFNLLLNNRYGANNIITVSLSFTYTFCVGYISVLLSKLPCVYKPYYSSPI